MTRFGFIPEKVADVVQVDVIENRFVWSRVGTFNRTGRVTRKDSSKVVQEFRMVDGFGFDGAISDSREQCSAVDVPKSLTMRKV